MRPRLADQLVGALVRRRSRGRRRPRRVPCASSAAWPSRKTRNGMAAPLDAGPMTRLRSRAWNWKAIASAGLVQHRGVPGDRPVPREGPVVERRAARARRRRGARRSARRPPARSRCSGHTRRRSRATAASASRRRPRGRAARPRPGPGRVVRAGVEQQLLDDHLGRGVLALAEVVIPDAAVARRRGRRPASSGSRRRARRRSRCRARSGSRRRRSRDRATTLSTSRSKPNSGVWTPMTVSPASAYFAAQART